MLGDVGLSIHLNFCRIILPCQILRSFQLEQDHKIKFQEIRADKYPFLTIQNCCARGYEGLIQSKTVRPARTDKISVGT